MYGAILGDIIGSPYEFDRGDKSKDFPLFIGESRFTDDTVMTVAVAEALLAAIEGHFVDDEPATEAIVGASMQKWGRRYIDRGYGGRFLRWLLSSRPLPYGSYGNGSAMRVSATGWLFPTLEQTLEVAGWTAAVTHDHPEGIKGAQATAAAVYLARTGKSKDEIKKFIEKTFDYDLSRTCDEIRPFYHHVESCQQTVPEAVTAFLEGESFEDVIRTAVSLGGDTDTLGAIAGAMGEAYYGVPGELKLMCRRLLKDDLLEVLDLFEEKTAKR